MLANATLDPETLAALLRWYVDMGVDCLVAEEPLDRFALSARARTAPKADPAPERAPDSAPLAPPNSIEPPHLVQKRAPKTAMPQQ